MRTCNSVAFSVTKHCDRKIKMEKGITCRDRPINSLDTHISEMRMKLKLYPAKWQIILMLNTKYGKCANDARNKQRNTCIGLEIAIVSRIFATVTTWRSQTNQIHLAQIRYWLRTIIGTQTTVRAAVTSIPIDTAEIKDDRSISQLCDPSRLWKGTRN